MANPCPFLSHGAWQAANYAAAVTPKAATTAPVAQF